MTKETGCRAQPVVVFHYPSLRWRGEEGQILREGGEHLSFLCLYRLQGARTYAESVQNTGRNLRGRDGSLQYRRFERRVGNDEADVGIAVAETAVLLILRGGVGVGGSILRLH